MEKMRPSDPNKPDMVVKATKMKISKVIEMGFKCEVCQTETVTHDETIAAACLNCHAPNPKIVWKNHITHTLTVRTLEFEK